IFEASKGRPVCRDENIAGEQRGSRGSAFLLDLEHHETHLSRARPHRPDGDTKRYTRTMLQKIGDGVTRDGQCETTRDDHRIESDDAALRVGQRTAGISRCEANVGLYPGP